MHIYKWKFVQNFPFCDFNIQLKQKWLLRVVYFKSGQKGHKLRIYIFYIILLSLSKSKIVHIFYNGDNNDISSMGILYISK